MANNRVEATQSSRALTLSVDQILQMVILNFDNSSLLKLSRCVNITMLAFLQSPFFLSPHYLTASLNAFAGLNFGVNLAAILIDSPVFGFLPFHAFLLREIKGTGTILICAVR